MSQTIPITLQAIPVPVTVQAANINQLLTIISQYIAGAINADVSFFQQGTVNPTQLTTQIFFNTTQGVFYQWDVGLGSYSAITQYQPGDYIQTAVAGDSPQIGRIVCDGRAFSAIQGISQKQLSVLNQLYGVGGSLPTLAPQIISGLPGPMAFSEIPVTDVSPPANQISNLPFSSDYNPAEEQALASNTETLRTSAASLKTSVAAIQAVSQSVLTALKNTTTANIYVNVFVGYP
jgi:hypothetical protein